MVSSWSQQWFLQSLIQSAFIPRTITSHLVHSTCLWTLCNCYGQPLSHIETLNICMNHLANDYWTWCSSNPTPSPYNFTLSASNGVHGMKALKSPHPPISPYTNSSLSRLFKLTGLPPTNFNQPPPFHTGVRRHWLDCHCFLHASSWQMPMVYHTCFRTMWDP